MNHEMMPVGQMGLIGSASSSPEPVRDQVHSSEDSEEQEDCLQKFSSKPPIPGLLKNFVVLFLNENGTEDAGDSSACSSQSTRESREEFLKDFGRAVCQYLIDNGIQTIRIDTNMRKQQLGSLVKNWSESSIRLGQNNVSFHDTPESSDDRASVVNTDVTIVLLERLLTRKSQDIMFEVVEGAIQSSRLGLLILVDTPITLDSELDKIQSSKWFEFVKYVKSHNLWDTHLEIVCATHGIINRVASAKAFKNLSPLGGCSSDCGKLSCGHQCPYPCHATDRDHVTDKYACKQPCDRKCPQGHDCDKYCYEDCEECLTVITIRNPCGHQRSKQIFCCDKEREICQLTVRKTLPCGHGSMMKCSDDPREVTCEYPTISRLQCGHVQYKLCSQDLRHSTCSVPVTVKLVCEHTVTVKCSEFLKYGASNIACPFVCNALLKCGHICQRHCHPEDPEHNVLTCLEPCQKRCPRNIHSCSDGKNPHKCGENCGPCNKTYENRLSCGHTVTEVCSSQEIDENNYECRQDCLKRLPICDHPCGKRCFEPCGPCEMEVVKKVPECPRRHSYVTKCQDISSAQCKWAMKMRASCGHSVDVPCFEFDTTTPTDASSKCDKKCTKLFRDDGECGHGCQGNCNKCYQGRLHLRCAEPCNKNLICGHLCDFACSMECPPCGSPCIQFCEHQKCDLPCGVPCSWLCEEPCQYKCPHSQCSKNCSEVCDKKLCNERCPKLLQCGHGCMGLCGELCPPYCRICSPSDLLLGDFSGKSEVDESDRFIFLEDCKHCIEIEGFEQWLVIRTTSEEIMPIQCPICRARIKWIRRYSTIFDENRKLIDSVRLKIFGSDEEIESVCSDIIEKLSPIQLQDHEDLETVRINIFREIASLRERKSCWTNISLAKFLKWLGDDYIEAIKVVLSFQKVLPPDFSFEYESCWLEYYDLFVDRDWPLHPNELKGLSLERKRLDDATKLYSRFSVELPQNTRDLVNSAQGQLMVSGLKSILWTIGAYTDVHQKMFKENMEEFDRFTQCTLALTEKEKKEIVSAFGGTAGRWFKCNAGHVYVITECGGAVEVGKCPECGSLIGGENHSLVRGNYLAPEMDGARAPLYPTVLDRPN